MGLWFPHACAHICMHTTCICLPSSQGRKSLLDKGDLERVRAGDRTARPWGQRDLEVWRAESTLGSWPEDLMRAMGSRRGSKAQRGFKQGVY